ncbi:hypothetical protein LK533_14195 [Sphingomonas sp. PL-96]|uniref:hypothetical protein n=1 Tax=Sphingomonas sp. PL-96 TaxID=2887201 RepID=UPI001E418B40|nr:hypothetical protein [Sphingomonas sp. PL-96]MCC2977822.1 hypothetical protein [Sphingomonas sp. PL-96]
MAEDLSLHQPLSRGRIARRMLEEALAQRPFIAGDRFTAADLHVGSRVMWGVQFGTLPGGTPSTTMPNRRYSGAPRLARPRRMTR